MYLIADTRLEINLDYKDLKFKFFLSDSPQLNGKLEINFGDLGVINNQDIQTENQLNWYYDETNHLCLKIIDPPKNTVGALMVFDHDFRSAWVKHKSLNNSIDDSYLDLLIFIFYVVVLLLTPGILLHSAAINWMDRGILFSAPSGTGKSTQAKLWCDYEKAEIINEDRPALTIRQDGIYVHGTPWTGSSPIVNNISRPIKAIVMLEQSPINEVVRLSPEEAVNLLLPRVFMPYFDQALTTWALDIVDQIIQKVPIYKLKCRPDVGAVEVLKKELSLLPE